MANAVTLFENMPQLPADVAAFFEEEANVLPKETIPSLSYSGKIWAISLNGEKKNLVKRNSEGDEEPLSVMRVILLDYNKRRGRAYYEGNYDPDKVTMPVCWSDDGLAPSVHVKEPPTDKTTGCPTTACAKCPMSVKGSKVTDNGKSVSACSEHRMIALIPAARLDFEPLRMKIAITSDWDGQSPDHEAQGWYGFKNYVDMLVTKGVKHTAMLVTKMKFDPNVAYPKVLFAADKWLDPDQLQQVVPVVKSENVKALISGAWAPNGSDATRLVEDKTETAKPVVDEVAKARAAKIAADLAAKTKAAATAKAAAEAKAKAEAEAAEAAEAAAAAGQVEDDDGDVELPGDPEPVKPKPAAKPAVAAAKPAAAKPAVAAAKPAVAAAKPVAAKAAVKPKPVAVVEEEPASDEAPAEAGENDLDSLLADWS